MYAVSQSDLLDNWKSLCKLLADYFLLLCTYVFVLTLFIDSMTIGFMLHTGTFLRMKGDTKPERTLGLSQDSPPGKPRCRVTLPKTEKAVGRRGLPPPGACLRDREEGDEVGKDRSCLYWHAG